MLQIALDREVALKVKAVAVGILKLAPELAAHGFVGEIGDVGEHARSRQAALRHPVGRIIPAVPARIVLDRLTADPVECDALGGKLRSRRNRHDAVHHIRKIDRPFKRLHTAHRTADHRQQPPHSEKLHKALLGAHHVADRDHREGQVVRIAVSGSIDRGPVEPAQLPMTLLQITKYRSVSIALPGPTISSHQPGFGSFSV